MGGLVIATPNRSLWEQLRDKEQWKPTSLALSEMPGHDLELKWDAKISLGLLHLGFDSRCYPHQQ